ncbi:hypothetical protein [Bradyrhizobium sp. YR681]|uniref:hypothetical protein n=1 Tax=Bradyrhizobium sp. YR681 TaxID=1144344 RepID=UPI0012F678CD|nr:hypothetical protein [Bradyrhizobium sp. YR681]
MLEIIKNLPTRLIDCILGLQGDPVSQILWLIVASAAGRLVYHIPEGKPNLVMRRKKKRAVPFGGGGRRRFCKNENARP